jgi:hypothetical protein
MWPSLIRASGGAALTPRLQQVIDDHHVFRIPRPLTPVSCLDGSLFISFAPETCNNLLTNGCFAAKQEDIDAIEEERDK